MKKIDICIPTIDNLRFRKSPSLNSNTIRLLNKNDKLKLIENGEFETIQGVSGSWVKVETIKGETGWCFNAYLKLVN